MQSFGMLKRVGLKGLKTFRLMPSMEIIAIYSKNPTLGKIRCIFYNDETGRTYTILQRRDGEAVTKPCLGVLCRVKASA
jgi:hypothetical protein